MYIYFTDVYAQAMLSFVDVYTQAGWGMFVFILKLVELPYGVRSLAAN